MAQRNIKDLELQELYIVFYRCRSSGQIVDLTYTRVEYEQLQMREGHWFIMGDFMRDLDNTVVVHFKTGKMEIFTNDLKIIAVAVNFVETYCKEKRCKDFKK